MTKPVQVFILMGQSNMFGMGRIAGNSDGSLEFAVKSKGLYPYLIDNEGNWTVRHDVRNVRVMNFKDYKNEWMTINDGTIGPEIGIGHYVGQVVDAPVMILKSCIGNRSLGWDLLPPGSEPYEYKGQMIPGYRGTPEDPRGNGQKVEGKWYAGKQYDDDTDSAKQVLADLQKYYPGATSYEIAGFFFWQGAKDGGSEAHAQRYEFNLVNFIKSLRKDFNAPDASFVIATMGQGIKGGDNNDGKITDAQLAVDGENGKYPEFKGNVATFYSHPVSRGGSANGHYGGNAETYMNVGEGMGRAMARLILAREQTRELEKKRQEEALALAATIEAGEKGTLLRLEREDYRMDPAKIAAVLQDFNTKDPKTLGTADRFLMQYFSKDWEEVRKFLSSLPANNASNIYTRILTTVQPARGRPDPFMTPGDIVGLIDAAPTDLDGRRDWIDSLGQTIDAALLKGEGHLLVSAFEQGTHRVGGREPRHRLVAGRILLRTEFKDDAIDFLPSYAQSVNIADAAVRAEVQGFLKSQLERDQVQSDELARAINEKYRVLLNAEATPAARDAALQTLMAEFNQVPTEIFASLLGGMLKVDPALAARAIIKAAQTMSSVAGADRPHDEHARVLRVMADISEILAKDVDLDDPDWRTVADLMTDVWVQSVQTFQRHWPKYMADQRTGSPREPPCAEPAELLAAAPREAWLSRLAEDKRRRVELMLPRVIMYGPRPKDAIPVIVQTVKTNPEGGLQLAKEFVSGWAAMNNPDIPPDVRKQYNIPADQMIVVTPLMIRKNIESLATVMTLLRENNVMPNDQEALASAFDACYGQAEVYEIADVEAVFGPITQMPEGVFAALIGKMTDALGKRWREISVQNATQTSRRHADVLTLVREGYGRAIEMIDLRLKAHPEDWHAMSRAGTLLSDWGDYEFFQTSTSETDSDRIFAYKEKNNEAFGYFKRAAEAYVAQAAAAPGRVSISVFTAWFDSLLGFNSNGEINVSKAMNPDVLNVMRELLWSLPERERRRHISDFAQYIDRRAEDKKKPLPAELRYKYLASGLVITRDSVFSMETRKQVEYFDELLKDVRLETRTDGGNTIGRGEDFGIIISLVHSDVLGELLNIKPYLTADSGKFRGAQNAHNNQGPIKSMANVRKYKNEFEKNIYDSFSNFFEIRSITYSPLDVQSRPIGREGWSETVMAYVQVRARGVEVDRIPPLELDLNYFDLSGPVALPVKSAETGIQITEGVSNSRPLENLQVRQVLDPRSMSSGGALTLEIKAEGFGLIPDLREILDLSVLEKTFPIREIKGDDMALVNELHSDARAIGVTSERSWKLTLDTAGIKDNEPVTLTFPKLKVQGATSIREVYQDADRVTIEKDSVVLGGTSGENGEVGIALPRRPNYAFWIVLVVMLVAGTLALAWWWVRKRAARESTAEIAERFKVPERLDAFDLVTLLRSMSRSKLVRLTPVQRDELRQVIKRVETSCFDPAQPEPATHELRQTAQHWVDAVS
ncbi:MAG: hypothetical protein GC164_15490 [Phycisphaera sp.]|nr:hypothetical protein [Phycisphaera sp.]